MAPCLLLAVVLTTFAISKGDESATGMVDDASSLPLMASGKRQHNIMRFGKRPAGGHSLIHFGKREEPQHRFLFMGKREEEEDGPVFPFLQRDDNSYKRGHTIMRFGKRGPPQGSHSFIRFGKRDDETEDEEKRANGHSMMYFGKRAGHNMMYFGKRGNGHSMMYFGKRNDDSDPGLYLVPTEDDAEKRAAHSMIHFGKREGEEEEESKRGSHSMIHFGKRLTLEEQEEPNENQLPIYWSPEMTEKRNFLRFGKKTEGSRARGSHAMIHFGKRSVTGNQSEAVVTRTKRDTVEEEDEESVPLYYPRSSAMFEEDSGYMEYGEPGKKDGSKNVFLRFG